MLGGLLYRLELLWSFTDLATKPSSVQALFGLSQISLFGNLPISLALVRPHSLTNGLS